MNKACKKNPAGICNMQPCCEAQNCRCCGACEFRMNCGSRCEYSKGSENEMNKNMLRSIMVLHGDTNTDLAEHLGISTSTLSCKMNETNGAEFNQTEIRIIKNRYDLTPEQVVQIFFG